MPFAARLTDIHACPLPGHGPNPIAKASGDVMIGGEYAAYVTRTSACGAPIVKGSLGVYINGFPAARKGDITAHGGAIISGFPTVIIGEIGAGGAGSLPSVAATMSAAKALGLPFTKTSCGE